MIRLKWTFRGNCSRQEPATPDDWGRAWAAQDAFEERMRERFKEREAEYRRLVAEGGPDLAL